MSLFGEVALPRWLEKFHALASLDSEVGTVYHALKAKPSPKPAIENLERVAPWLDRLIASDQLGAQNREEIEAKTGAMRRKLQDGSELTLWEIRRAMDQTAEVIQRIAASILATRTENERKLSFVSEFYLADHRRSGAEVNALGLTGRHGLDKNTVVRVAEWATDEYLLDKCHTNAYVRAYRITTTGRRWFTGHTTETVSDEHGPWWMSADDPNQKWASLGSRRAYDRDVARAVTDATAERPLSALFIDFDNLKKLNTEVGNTRADQSLGAVIAVIGRAVFAKGRAYLHGNGDEFVVLLPNASKGEAFATGQRICDETRALALDGLPTPTVSIGVATAPTDGDDPTVLEEAACAAQRKAKENGKGRVEAAR